MNNKEIEIEKREFHKFGGTKNNPRNFGYLVIPKYQRRYNWKEDEVMSFLDEITTKADILEKKFPMFKSDVGNLENIFKEYSNDYVSPRIYFGNIVITISRDDQPDEIVDGQQRISTFAITLKLLSLYEEKITNSDVYKKNKRAFMPLIKKMKKILSFETENCDTFSMISSMNKHDKVYLENVFDLLDVNDLPSNKSNNSYLRNMKIIDGVFSSKNSDQLLFILLSLMTTEFGIVSFEGEERAYELFEALNSKGLQLSPSDLIKNYVFKTLHKTDDDAEKIWTDFIMKFRAEEKTSPQEITSFIRSYLMSKKHQYIKKTTLFAEMKKSFGSENIGEFMRELTEINSLMQEIRMGTWKDKDKFKNIHMFTMYINNLPKIYDSLIMFFINNRKISKETFQKIVEYLFKQAFIHWPINNLPSKEIDKNVIDVMLSIEELKDEELKWVDIKEIFNINILNETFGENNEYDYKSRIETLKSKNFDNRKNLLLLYRVINDYKNASKEEFTDYKIGEIDLEHLLPQSPSEGWYTKEGFSDKTDADKYIHKLGNTLFIYGTINKTIKNKIFREKLESKEFLLVDDDRKDTSLKESEIFIKEMKWAFGDIPKEWTKTKIKSRTEKIVNFIVKNNLFNPKKI